MKFSFIIGLLLISFGLFAQNKYLKTVNETQNLSQKVIDLFMNDKVSEAFDQLIQYWPLPKDEMESVKDKSIKYLNIIEERYGKIIGSFKVKNETISNFAIRETYLIRYQNSAIRLIFIYYRNNKGWLINSFNWDDSFEDEFK